MNKIFRGVCTVAVTPFTEDGSFDIPAAKENLDKLIEAGVHGICILGATGEYMSMSNEEHKAYINEIVPYISDRVTVMVGATREYPDHVIDLIENAKKAGANAAMVLPSPYCHPSPNEVEAHYKYISDKTGFPLMAYNNPGSAGVDISVDSFREIFKIENMALVKESSGEIGRLIELLEIAPEDVSILWGSDCLAFEGFVAGADGWVCMLSNVAPRDCVELYESVCVRKDYDKGFEIYKKLRPALNFLESFPKPVQALKYILTLMGQQGGFVRRPRLELSDDEKKIIEKNIEFRKFN